MTKRGLSPVHPGESLREEYIVERKLILSEVADGLGINIAKLTDVIDEKKA